MSTVPSPLKSPLVQRLAGLIVMRQHDGQVVDVHPAVDVGVAGQDCGAADGVRHAVQLAAPDDGEAGVVRCRVERQVVRRDLAPPAPAIAPYAEIGARNAALYAAGRDSER